MRRSTVILALALGLLFCSQGVAVAVGTSTAAGYKHVSWSDCTWGSVTITSEILTLNLRSVATLDWLNLLGQQCGNPNAQAAPWDLAVKQDLAFLSNVTQQWEFCNVGPWLQTPNQTHAVGTSFDWGLWNRMPCPGHFYFGVSRAAYHHGGGVWHGLDAGHATHAIWSP